MSQMNNSGSTISEFTLVIPFVFLLIFFLLSGVLYLSEKFLLKYAIYVETRKLLPQQENVSFEEKKRVETSILQWLAFLPFHKRVIFSKINQSEKEVSLKARLYYYLPSSVITSFFHFNLEEACVLKK